MEALGRGICAPFKSIYYFLNVINIMNNSVRVSRTEV